MRRTKEWVLKDSTDPLLYWQVPILVRPNGLPPDRTRRRPTAADYQRYYDDQIFAQTGSEHWKNEFPDDDAKGDGK